MEIEHLKIIRQNVDDFVKYCAATYAVKGGSLLDVAPQNYQYAKFFSSDKIAIDSFDLDHSAGTTYTGDICKHNACLADNSYDYVLCAEVLEHVLQPFDAVRELWRILKSSGFLFLTTPFNFRIHGPLPDCWRFTEHGLRVLLSNFDILDLKAIKKPDRPLMPIHYTVVAQKSLKRR